MYSGVVRSSYRQHSCDDVTKLGLCDWFTNELTDWRRRRRRRRRKEITYETLGLHLVQKFLVKLNFNVSYSKLNECALVQDDPHFLFTVVTKVHLALFSMK